VPGLSRDLYFFEGEQLQVDGDVLPVLHSCRLRSERAVTLQNGAKAARLLLLQGRPIGEPVAHHGPFVMNTREELMQAFADYQRDQFGGWPWPQLDQVHARRGRFALYADGREERPGTAAEGR
ncbi:MAG TPA: pirin-like C-terminal cupin domain-containing protein, partial [Hyphomicrobiales bacterium]|nr:pirin-like C-terminal cupin domain-containing protein [Hyphomicrobiales bacterium]